MKKVTNGAMGVDGGLKISILTVTSFLNGSLWKGIIFKRPVQFSKAVDFYATFKLWKCLPYFGVSSKTTFFRKYTLKLHTGNYRHWTYYFLSQKVCIGHPY